MISKVITDEKPKPKNSDQSQQGQTNRLTQSSQNQPIAGSTSRLLQRFDRLLAVRKYITIMMKLKAFHLSSDRVRKKQYMHQLCGKQTRLCGQISKDDKLIKTLSECTEQRLNEKHFKVLPTI